MPKSDTSEANILIVDDSLGNRKVLSLILRDTYQIHTADSGTAALQSAQETELDLILLDIMMPGLSGYDVCERLKAEEQTQDIPVIFLSALDDPQSKVKSFEVGGADFISKPFQSLEVLARVKNHIATRKLQRQLEQINSDLEDRIATRTTELLEANINLKEQIHERNRIEESLHESEETYRTLFENSKDAIFIASPNGHLIDMNPAGLNLFGYSEQQLQQIDIADLSIGPLDQFRETIDKDGAVKDFAIDLKRKDGSVMHCLVTANVQRDSNGVILSYQGIVRDVTEQRRIQHERLLLLSIQRELGIAQEIQESLLPPSKPDWADLDVVCRTTPAREMGGDLYAYYHFTPDKETSTNHTTASPATNYQPAPRQKYALCVGDVSGKGVPAALLMSISLASFRSVVNPHLSPKNFLARMNSILQDYTQRSRQNCALVYIEVTPPSAGEQVGRLIAANAGCIAPLLKRKHGSVEWVDVGGLPLGVGLANELGYNEIDLDVEQGDMIILTSDGVIESRNETGQMFGFEGIKQAVQTAPMDDANAMLDYLLNEVTEFIGANEPHDDMTVVVLKV